MKLCLTFFFTLFTSKFLRPLCICRGSVEWLKICGGHFLDTNVCSIHGWVGKRVMLKGYWLGVCETAWAESYVRGMQLVSSSYDVLALKFLGIEDVLRCYGVQVFADVMVKLSFLITIHIFNHKHVIMVEVLSIFKKIGCLVAERRLVVFCHIKREHDVTHELASTSMVWRDYFPSGSFGLYFFSCLNYLLSLER